jgi:hypothetical protein
MVSKSRINKNRATAQSQNLLIKPLEHDVLEEINIGDTKMRLCSLHSGKSIFIQLWSSLSNQWNTTHRYNVQTEWDKWKKYAFLHRNRSKNGGIDGSNVQSYGSPKASSRKPRSTTNISSPENSIGNQRRKVKNP